MKLNFIKSNLQVVNITYGEIIKQNHTVSKPWRQDSNPEDMAPVPTY